MFIQDKNIRASNSSSSLSELYRLYSPSNKIKPYQKYTKNNPSEQPPVIQLICAHPHLLFIPSQNNINPKQKHSATEFNILKGILQRKKQYNNINKKSAQSMKNKKPMTAPNIKREKRHNLTTQPEQRKQPPLSKTDINFHHQNTQINVLNFNDFQQHTPHSAKHHSNNNDSTINLSPYIPTHSLKPRSSFSRTKRQSQQHNNQQMTQFSEKLSYRNSLNRNTIDMSLDEKRKTIRLKYEQDKVDRESKYKNNNPKAQLYVNAQAKFAKFVKKFH